MPDLCLFDLDDTLLPFDSDHAWGEFVCGLGWVDGDAFRACNETFFADYRAGTLDIHAYVAFSTRPLQVRDAATLAAAQARFMRQVVAPRIRPAALDLVRGHRERGDLIALVTATNEFVTAPIAAAFGIGHLIAVRLERDAAGTITGRIDGTPSFREGKVARVDDWLQGLGRRWSDFAATTVYSDSANDLPLLERASRPVATNPSAPLEALARERGWRTVRLFDDQDTDR